MTDLARAARGSVLTLTHFGRKSGKAYKTKLWYIELDGELWIGSLAADRAWVRNARAAGRAELDLGDGPRAVELEYCGDAADVGRYRAAINRTHWILGPLLRWFVSGTECAFRVRPSAQAAEPPRSVSAAPSATPAGRRPLPATPVQR